MFHFCWWYIFDKIIIVFINNKSNWITSFNSSFGWNQSNRKSPSTEAFYFRAYTKFHTNPASMQSHLPYTIPCGNCVANPVHYWHATEMLGRRAWRIDTIRWPEQRHRVRSVSNTDAQCHTLSDTTHDTQQTITRCIAFAQHCVAMVEIELGSRPVTQPAASSKLQHVFNYVPSSSSSFHRVCCERVSIDLIAVRGVILFGITHTRTNEWMPSVALMRYVFVRVGLLTCTHNMFAVIFVWVCV